MLRRPDVDFETLDRLSPQFASISNPIRRFLQSERLYSEQAKRAELKINLFRREENLEFPPDFDFKLFKCLSTEEREKLEKFNPRTLGEALRIDGITPTSILQLHAACRKQSRIRETIE